MLNAARHIFILCKPRTVKRFLKVNCLLSSSLIIIANNQTLSYTSNHIAWSPLLLSNLSSFSFLSYYHILSIFILWIKYMARDDTTVISVYSCTDCNESTVNYHAEYCRDIMILHLWSNTARHDPDIEEKEDE